MPLSCLPRAMERLLRLNGTVTWRGHRIDQGRCPDLAAAMAMARSGAGEGETVWAGVHQRIGHDLIPLACKGSSNDLHSTGTS